MKIRPQDRGPIKLGVGRLPEEKVAQTLLATGADDQVGWRLSGGVEVLLQQVLGDIFRIDLVLHQVLDGPDDFGAAAVIEGHVQGEPVEIGGCALHLAYGKSQGGGMGPMDPRTFILMRFSKIALRSA